MMNEGEKQAFLSECAHVQNLVRTSVSNLNRLFDSSGKEITIKARKN